MGADTLMTWHAVPGEDAIYTRTQIPPAALEGVPHSRDHDLVVVRNTYADWLRLRERGLLVPPPLSTFRFSGRHTPREHQRRGVEFLLSNKRCALLHPMGAGKTLTTAWAMDFLFQHGAIRRALIVAPKSVCSHVWQRELFTEFPHLSAALAAGDAARKRMIGSDEGIQVVIINYESLHILKDLTFDLVVCDEVTRCKTVNTKTWRNVAALSHDKWFWGLTGTPTPQSPMDAYGQIRLLRGNVMTKTRWQGMTMRQITSFKWLPLPDADQTVARWLQPAQKVRAEDCYDVPEVETIEVEYDLTPQQIKLSKDLADEARAELDGTAITAANAAHVLTKQLQAFAGGVYGEERSPHLVPAKPFYEAIEELVEGADTPVLIFCSYRVNAMAVAAYLESRKLDTGLITGDTSGPRRSELFDAVQAGKIQALVAVPSTMSHGITLTASRYVVWVTPPFSNETYEQSVARVVRQGQRNAVKVYHMVANKLSRTLFTRLRDKSRLQDAVLALIK